MSVLEEDEHFLFFNKPSEIATEELLANLNSQRPKKLHLVHRLDLNTTGVLALAKSPEAANHFRVCKNQKIYLAACQGSWKHPQNLWWKLEGFLEENREKSRIFASPTPRAKRFSQEVWLLSKAEKYSCLLVRLHTGRKHQIRASLAHLGHALLGDQRYGNGKHFKRPALHAYSLVFSMLKPSQGAYNIFAPLPPDLLSCARMAGYDGSQIEKDFAIAQTQPLELNT